MRISKEMLEEAKIPGWVREMLQETEYPTKDSKRRYVMQSHIRGESQHTDCRFEFNDHLIGFEVVGGSVDKPVTPDKWEINKGQRAEWKARQPKDWLKVEGKIPPGEIGAGKEVEGEFIIVSKGEFWEGVMKPYFKEFFVKSDRDIGPLKKDKYVRLVLRGLRLPRLDPETKKPLKGKFEIMWRFMVPETQIAYAMDKRAIKEKWKPPKGIIPVPPDQREGDLWIQWQEYMKGKVEDRLQKQDGFFTLHQVSWMGPVHVRGMPQVEYYLRIAFPSSLQSWQLTGNPLRSLPQGALSEGKVNIKWLTFEGTIKPGEKYNPTKTLDATMMILDTGKVKIDETVDERLRTIYLLDLHGKRMKGKLKLVQEEKDSDTWTLEELSETLTQYNFVLHKHYGEEIGTHFDLRWKISNDHKQELNLERDPRDLKEEQKMTASFKDIHEDPKTLESWMVKEGKHLERPVGPLETFIDVEDSGNLNIIEQTENFISMEIHGETLKGLYVAKKEDSQWYFIHSTIPTVTLNNTTTLDIDSEENE